MIAGTVVSSFGPGTFTLETNDDLSALEDDERLMIAFADFEALFTVIGRAREAIHLGMYLTPWSYIHWRAELRKGRWALSTTDRSEILRLARFYRVKP